MRSGRTLFLFVVGVLYLFSCGVARADLYGRIRGAVSDSSGAVVPKARIIATNNATGISKEAISEEDGNYEFLQLAAPAIYTLVVEAPGFKKFEVNGIHLELNEIFVENLRLELGPVDEKVVVAEVTTAQVETTDIELGTIINSTEIANAPLNGRVWVDLMKLQPGVVEASDPIGVNGHPDDYATNGSQSQQNDYLINGTESSELFGNSALIYVSPDAIGEVKIVTNTINPEYGRNSGAIVNAEIKSGTNEFHGNGFDFYRDTSLNARNFFQPSPAVFHRNMFGGTVGGPIRKNRTFFFFSYEGYRERIPISPGGNVQVFTPDERNGIFSDLMTSSKISPYPLVGDDGLAYPAGTPYSTIFSTGQIPKADINPISATLLSFVPTGTLLTSKGELDQFNPIERESNDQLLGRVDHTFGSRDAIWGYWYWERFPFINDIPGAGPPGSGLPGFAAKNLVHLQQYTAAWNHTFSPTMINEVRIGYTRDNFEAGFPLNPVAPSSVGFTGIKPQLPSVESLPGVSVNGPSVSNINFSLGFAGADPQPRIEDTYQASDSLTKNMGNHAFKFGFSMGRYEINQSYSTANSGIFRFGGAGAFSTGDAGADFLLGIPDNYMQGGGDVYDGRDQLFYSYFQDQWKIRSNLTITYGMGWSVYTPITDMAHDNHAGIAFRPGQQSTVFPNAPEGYVFQGDAGVNAFGTTKFKDFGPRLGLAYSPDWGRWTGGPGRTSIRAGFGIYYNRSDGGTADNALGSPPFQVTSFGVGDIGGSPSFANPYSGWELNRGTIPSCTAPVCAISEPNKFPSVLSPSTDFSVFLPLSISVIDPKMTIPYAENYNLTIEREFGASTVVSVGYVGAQGRHLQLVRELNPGINPGGCAANPTCVDDASSQATSFPGNFAYPGNIFASIGEINSAGTSNYNSLQVSMNHNFSQGLQFLVAYTWSHAMDLASSLGNSGGFGFGQFRSTNPFNPRLDYGDSIYDARNRLVVSYVYKIPSVRHFQAFHWMSDRVTDGWSVSGITTFQSGFPLDVIDSGFPSLTCSGFNYYGCWDVPNLVGKIQYLNPRSNAGNYWFAATPTGAGCSATPVMPPCQIGAFSAPVIGSEGNAGRDIIRGPGRNNFDGAVMKDTQVTERIKFELRFEFFNLFNHTQFDPSGINTDFNSSGFGTETAAYDPRIIELAAKFYY